MTTQLLFYDTAVPVSRDRHGDLSVSTGEDYGFAADVNAVPLTAVEFARASAEYPIVFAGSGEGLMPMAVLGARQTENLFVDGKGAWKGEYIPAFVRRYPFVFTTAEDPAKLVLLIDEQYAGVNREGRGERLFDDSGERTEYLEGILKFLQAYQTQLRRTQAFCRRLNELDLLQPVQAKLPMGDNEMRTLSGFKVVDREKLKELEPGTIQQMLKTDELECAFLQLASLKNFGKISSRLASAGEDDLAAAPERPGGATNGAGTGGRDASGEEDADWSN